MKQSMLSTPTRIVAACLAAAALVAAVAPGLAAAGAPYRSADVKPGSRNSGRRTRKPSGASPHPAAKAAIPPRPDKRLTPDQVVRFQMQALQHNDVPRPDNGIATTFAFASPQNRLATGPIEHFTQIVKSPAYFPMLNCRKVTYDPVVIDGDTARQRVHIVGADGSRISYTFILSRQKDGPYAGCWMNDGCVRDDADAEAHRFDA
jgi:hypothetical protein